MHFWYFPLPNRIGEGRRLVGDFPLSILWEEGQGEGIVKVGRPKVYNSL
jgi:hypothetical protein